MGLSNKNIIATIVFLIVGLGSIYLSTYPIIFSIVFGLIMFGGYSYLSILMIIESTRPKDWLTPLRYRILLVVSLAVITLIPSLVYQWSRLLGIEAELLRSIVTVASRINGIATLFLLYSIFTYKRRDTLPTSEKKIKGPKMYNKPKEK